MKHRLLIMSSLLFVISLYASFHTSAHEINNFDKETLPVSDTQVVEISCDNGTTKLIDNGTFITIVTTTSSNSNLITRNNNPGQQLDTTAYLFVPYDSETYDQLYSILNSNLDLFPKAANNFVGTISNHDKNKCAIFNLSVSYTRETMPDGYDYFDIQSVSGGYTDNGTTGNYVGENVYVTNQSLDVVQTGSNLYNNQFVTNQCVMGEVLSPSSRSWTFLPPSSWSPVTDSGIGGHVAARYHFTLARGGSSWSGDLDLTFLSTVNW